MFAFRPRTEEPTPYTAVGFLCTDPGEELDDFVAWSHVYHHFPRRTDVLLVVIIAGGGEAPRVRLGKLGEYWLSLDWVAMVEKKKTEGQSSSKKAEKLKNATTKAKRQRSVANDEQHDKARNANTFPPVFEFFTLYEFVYPQSSSSLCSSSSGRCIPNVVCKPQRSTDHEECGCHFMFLADDETFSSKAMPLLRRLMEPQLSRLSPTAPTEQPLTFLCSMMFWINNGPVSHQHTLPHLMQMLLHNPRKSKEEQREGKKCHNDSFKLQRPLERYCYFIGSEEKEDEEEKKKNGLVLHNGGINQRPHRGEKDEWVELVSKPLAAAAATTTVPNADTIHSSSTSSCFLVIRCYDFSPTVTRDVCFDRERLAQELPSPLLQEIATCSTFMFITSRPVVPPKHLGLDQHLRLNAGNGYLCGRWLRELFPPSSLTSGATNVEKKGKGDPQFLFHPTLLAAAPLAFRKANQYIAQLRQLGHDLEESGSNSCVQKQLQLAVATTGPVCAEFAPLFTPFFSEASLQRIGNANFKKQSQECSAVSGDGNSDSHSVAMYLEEFARVPLLLTYAVAIASGSLLLPHIADQKNGPTTNAGEEEQDEKEDIYHNGKFGFSPESKMQSNPGDAFRSASIVEAMKMWIWGNFISLTPQYDVMSVQACCKDLEAFFRSSAAAGC